jgi:tetratricopeptide (TPR) repeat protein
LERAVHEHPELERLAPAFFQRGGPNCRTLAFHLAVGLDTPSLREALRDFALSQHGPDALRMEAARQARNAGLLSATAPVRLWLEGEWREILLLEFEVYEEADPSRHSEEVTLLAEEALHALYDNRAAEGEAVLHRALELEPDSPDLLNNLASAYEFQGRHEESRRLVDEIHQRFPDYLFARTNLAIHAAREGHLERARELLEPVLKQGRYHVSEFSALCQAQLEVQTADGKIDAAMQWLELWESLAGEDPRQAYWEQRLLLEGLKGMAPLIAKPRKRRKRAA